jgi:S-adenosylmethionine:tRNA ribosyltransferase-isomerase
LPHYIRGGREMPGDRQRYQTVYAKYPGSSAAPTAGLHFTSELIEELEARGIGIARVTLHVGVDTFRPITTPGLSEHRLHSEWCQLLSGDAQRMNECRARGGRLVAVGTTSVRVLETAAVEGQLKPWVGSTDLFIRPPYEFRAVDALLTNFHLPKTTLLVLVRTFGGDELIMRAYEEAIRQQYRFYSFGDAMLIL